MNRLETILRESIRAEGPMDVARYMEFALQHPDYGYYRKTDRLGAGGDFTTSPEISQMFGELIGLWCAEAWRGLGKPPVFTLLELGPGRGTLMSDALRATRKVEGFHAALRLKLMESNETFRAMQREALSPFSPEYIETFSELPNEPLIVVANEFFDALPIRQQIGVEKEEKWMWAERKIGLVDDRLAFVAVPALPFGKAVTRETSPLSLALMRELSRRIVRQGGAALVVDYGYVTPSECGTLQAVSRHRSVDPLSDPGEADLTAHVDFWALSEAAKGEGSKVLGPVAQAEFLENLGIEIRANLLKKNATPEQAKAIDQALDRLTNPSQMGSLFKAMAIVSSGFRELPGFEK
jgi:NADH dehydrogenase [ubiquinone] 1 alpha subcomplex assembly factor 7